MSHPGFLVTKEDLRQIERILNQLADFVTIVHDQQIGDDLLVPDLRLPASQKEDLNQIF